MSRLIIASNRVGDFNAGPQSGGLAVALCDVLEARGGMWFGTAERSSRRPRRADDVASLHEAAPGVQVAEITIEKHSYQAYYSAYANSLLWPICHNRIDLARFDGDCYAIYREVNDRIARAIARYVRDSDVIWVHDYHLIPLGEHLRQRGVSNPIGFFLHIPFPPGDVFAALPQHEALAHSLGHYDLVGFQTENHVASFLGYLQRHLGGRILNDGTIRLNAAVIRAGCFPIGIDTADFARAAATTGEDDEIPPVGAPLVDHVIGVDRLDYSKGLIQRFQAFATFLDANPHRRRRVTFTQIAPPTRQGLRTYAHIRNELERLAGSINGRFGDLDWMPIHYIHRAFPRASLARLYRRARVGLVTPTQDGMNLVAKEYVAAQDPADPGVLILSKFAGAAAQLKAALIVNPHDIDECARSIEAALRMPLEERRERQREMFDIVAANDLGAWRRTFLNELEKAALANRALRHPPRPGPDRPAARTVPVASRDAVSPSSVLGPRPAGP